MRRRAISALAAALALVLTLVTPALAAGRPNWDGPPGGHGGPGGVRDRKGLCAVLHHHRRRVPLRRWGDVDGAGSPVGECWLGLRHRCKRTGSQGVPVSVDGQ